MPYPSASLYPSDGLYPSETSGPLYPSESLYPSDSLYPRDGGETGAAITSTFSGAGTLATALSNYRRISSTLSGGGTLTTTLALSKRINTSFSGAGSLTTTLGVPRKNLFPHPSAEGAGITWTMLIGGANSVTRSSEQAWIGAESYKLTASTATAQRFRTPSGTAGFPVTAGQPYAFSFYTLAASTARGVSGTIAWYTAAGAPIEETSLGGAANSTAAWTRTGLVVTAPATAAYASVAIRFDSMPSGEVHYIDGLLFEQSATINDYTESAAAPVRSISSAFSGAGTLSTRLSNYRRIRSSFSGAGSLTTSGLSPAAPASATINATLGGEGVLFTELAYVVAPLPLESLPLGKLVSFNVSTSAVPLNPAEGSGAAPSVTAGYIKGVDPEFALGETNVLAWGTVGTYEGEIVRLSLPEGSDVASISQDTALTLLNNELNLFPFIDAAPSLWTAARAIDYWTQQCGLFYDKVPGDCIAYASGFGHTDSYGAQTTARFYEKLDGGTTSTAVVNGRSVKTLGSAVSGTTAFHELPEGRVAVSVPRNRKLVASAGLGLRGTGREATVAWNMIDHRERTHTITIKATSAGLITALVAGVPVDSVTVPANADYRVAFSIELLSAASAVGKLTVHTDDLAGSGELVHGGSPKTFSYALPTVVYLTSIHHLSTGGSGAEMLRWGTYLTVAEGHPLGLPAVQKAFSQTAKPFGFVSGFQGNVWALLNEYCAITRQDISFLDSKLRVTPRMEGFTAPRGSYSSFSRDSERREKYKQVAVVNKQSKAVSTNDAVLWRADSVFQVAAREVFETTVQTGHSILSLTQPVAVDGIWPFPYKQGGGQYVVTGADGYIIAPAWWNDHGGKVEVSLTGTEGEIAIKITAPAIDTVRAPYRISEGEADRPALYVSGSGILNDPKEIHVGTGAVNAKEGFDSVFESPFIAGPMEAYDTASAMASEYSASMADVSFEVANDFYTPSRFGQFPAGMRFTDGKRTYRITSASQTHSKVSGNAVPHTTIADYVASYPAGATIAEEKARHFGRTIKQFNISPLKGKQ